MQLILVICLITQYEGAATASRTRGVFGGGEEPRLKCINYVTIASTGNATDFGDLTVGARRSPGAISNSTRGVFGGGRTPNRGKS